MGKTTRKLLPTQPNSVYPVKGDEIIVWCVFVKQLFKIRGWSEMLRFGYLYKHVSSKKCPVSQAEYVNGKCIFEIWASFI